MPSDAHKLMPDGSVKDVPLGELVVNDKVLIKPGEKIPADGVIVKGESSVNEAMLTGESTPAPKRTGAKVIGGAINAAPWAARWTQLPPGTLRRRSSDWRKNDIA
jgi:Cu2+-exporting ATPase